MCLERHGWQPNGNREFIFRAPNNKHEIPSFGKSRVCHSILGQEQLLHRLTRDRTQDQIVPIPHDRNHGVLVAEVERPISHVTHLIGG